MEERLASAINTHSTNQIYEVVVTIALPDIRIGTGQ